MAFCRTFNSLPAGSTENGAPAFTASQLHKEADDVFTAITPLYFQLVRGCSPEFILEQVETIIAEDYKNTRSVLFHLLFQTRNCRKDGKGKGERLLFYHLFDALYTHYPDECKELLFLLVERYGSWQDLRQLWELTTHDIVKRTCVELFAHQLAEDSTSDTKTLAGRWAPREKNHYKEMARAIARTMFPRERHPLPMYRRLIVALNTALDTPQVKMCSGRWAEIDVEKLTSRFTFKSRLALLDQDNTGQRRHVGDEDRDVCREHYRTMLDTCPEKVKATCVFPHECVKSAMFTHDDTVQAIWNGLNTTWGPHLSKMKAIPMVDVSGSMNGIPMEVAIALGMLFAKNTHSDFRNHLMTFHSNPSWFNIDDDWSLHECVRRVMTMGWGMNTNFRLAWQRILDVAILRGIPNDEMPKFLFVLSDMQFDESCNPREFDAAYDEMSRVFSEAGFTLPSIIFWNLRATANFPTTSTQKGVVMISGFSPAVLKAFSELDLDDFLSYTPAMFVREILMDPFYDRVDEVLGLVGDGAAAAGEG